MHNLVKGRIAESVAIAKLLEYGFEVFSSVADILGTDLVVAPPNSPKKLLRIQVKSVTSSNKSFRIQPDHKIVDYYLLLNTENDNVWLVPYSEVIKKLQEIKKHPKIKDFMLPIFHKEWQQYQGFDYLLKQIGNSSIKFHAGRIGKVGEKKAISYFLKNGFNVYESVADKEGVDLLVSKDEKFFEVQVKYSSKGYSFRNINLDLADTKYYFLFISGLKNEFFFRPSLEIKKIIGKATTIMINKKLQKLWNDQ